MLKIIQVTTLKDIYRITGRVAASTSGCGRWPPSASSLVRTGEKRTSGYDAVAHDCCRHGDSWHHHRQVPYVNGRKPRGDSTSPYAVQPLPTRPSRTRQLDDF